MTETFPDYRVAYLLEGDAPGTPLAVFLDSTSDCTPGEVLVYSPTDQHAEVGMGYLRTLPEATGEQSRDLHGYLTLRYADGTAPPLSLVRDQDGLSALLYGSAGVHR